MPRRSDRREVMPSRRASGNRRGPSFGRSTNVSVPISFGLPLLVVGAFLLITGVRTDSTAFWIGGGIALAAGAALFASGKRL
jgi:hypothetical protein